MLRRYARRSISSAAHHIHSQVEDKQASDSVQEGNIRPRLFCGVPWRMRPNEDFPYRTACRREVVDTPEALTVLVCNHTGERPVLDTSFKIYHVAREMRSNEYLQ